MTRDEGRRQPATATTPDENLTHHGEQSAAIERPSYGASRRVGVIIPAPRGSRFLADVRARRQLCRALDELSGARPLRAVDQGAQVEAVDWFGPATGLNLGAPERRAAGLALLERAGRAA